jgi:hypothetical protein
LEGEVNNGAFLPRDSAARERVLMMRGYRDVATALAVEARDLIEMCDPGDARVAALESLTNQIHRILIEVHDHGHASGRAAAQ